MLATASVPASHPQMPPLASLFPATRGSSGSTDVEVLLEDWSTSSSDSSSSGSTASESDFSSVSSIQRSIHRCRTADGWNLHLVNVVDEAVREGAGQQRQHPVLLVPGLASSGETFDLDPSASMAEYLAARGWDVWIADLRGNGNSDKPSYLDASTWWSVDDHLNHDVPAVVSYVLAATRSKQLHWMGHSMGGMLACGVLSTKNPAAPALKSITMLASGCFGRGSWHAWCAGLINLLCRSWGFPAGILCWLLGLLAGTVLSLTLFETLFFWRSNLHVPIQRKLLQRCFSFIPAAVILQFIGSLNSREGLSSQDGCKRFADPEVLASVDVPVLAINGDWDLFCPAAGGLKTVQMFGSRAKRILFLGPAFGTSDSHYGHFDVLVGKKVHQEVYPWLAAWLDEQDAPAAAPVAALAAQPSSK